MAATYNTVDDPGGTDILYLGSSNGNSTNADGSLLYDFNIWEAQAELNLTLGKLPLQAYIDYAQNTDPDDLNRLTASGSCSARRATTGPGSSAPPTRASRRMRSSASSSIRTSAAGKTDADGWIFKVGYVPVKNWTLNGTYFLNKIGVDAGNDVGYDRLQLDLNYKF